MKQAIYPFLETHDLYGGQFDPLDGDIDPAQLTQALAKGARDLGAKIIRFCPVTGVKWLGDEWKITTPNGEIRAEYVVNAAGYRAGELGKMFGRDVPCVSLAHQYLITEPIAELTARDEKLPLLRDPDSSYYLRQEKDGLLLGPYEKNCRAHWLSSDDPMPDDFSFQLYNDDLERLEWYIEDACARVPILGTAGITRVVNGPIPLPTNKRIYTVLRSPHVNKKAREQFELSSYKRLLDIYSSSSKTIDALMKLELPSGVEVEIKV